MTTTLVDQWLADREGLPPFDVTPLFSGGRTLSELVPRWWRRVRRPALERAEDRCEVCEARPGVGERALHVHEAWRYDVPGRVQWLERLWVLCWRCHHLAHGQPGSWPAGREGLRTWKRLYALTAAAVDEARPRRFVVFRIDLRRGGVELPAGLVEAFELADAVELPGRIRNLVRAEFDERLRRGMMIGLFAGELRGFYNISRLGRRAG